MNHLPKAVALHYDEEYAPKVVASGEGTSLAKSWRLPENTAYRSTKTQT